MYACIVYVCLWQNLIDPCSHSLNPHGEKMESIEVIFCKRAWIVQYKNGHWTHSTNSHYQFKQDFKTSELFKIKIWLEAFVNSKLWFW